MTIALIWLALTGCLARADAGAFTAGAWPEGIEKLPNPASVSSDLDGTTKLYCLRPLVRGGATSVYFCAAPKGGDCAHQSPEQCGTDPSARVIANNAKSIAAVIQPGGEGNAPPSGMGQPPPTGKFNFNSRPGGNP